MNRYLAPGEITPFFAQQLRRDPAFEPPSQARRARCALCGAYHPGASCARCQHWLDEARQLLIEQETLAQVQSQRAALRARLTQKHAAQRQAALYRWKQSRRSAARLGQRARKIIGYWLFERVGVSAALLRLGVVVALLAALLAVEAARPALLATLLVYLVVVMLLSRFGLHQRLKRRPTYARYHARRVGRVALHGLLHWVMVLLAGGVLGASIASWSAAIAVPAPQMTPEKGRFWTSAEAWNAWTRDQTTAPLVQAGLQLAARSQARVTALYPVGGGARYLGMAPDGAHVFVTRADGVLARVRTRDGALEAKVKIGGSLRDVAVAPSGEFVYVAAESRNEIVRVEASTLKITARVSVGNGPSSVSFAPDGAFAIVCSHGDGTLTQIRARDNRVNGRLALGAAAWEAVVGANGQIYVAVEGANQLRRLRAPRTLVNTALPDDPWDVSVARDAKFALVAHGGAPRLSRVERDRLTATIALPQTAWDVAIAPDGDYAFASTEGKALLVIRLDRNALSQTLKMPAPPREIAFAPDGTFALVACGNSLARIEGGAPVFAPRGLARTQIEVAPSSAPPRLVKNDALGGGALDYYFSWRPRQTPPLNKAERESAWRARGWTKIKWTNNAATFAPARTGRHLELAIYAATPNAQRSPLVKSLRLVGE